MHHRQSKKARQLRAVKRRRKAQAAGRCKASPGGLKRSWPRRRPPTTAQPQSSPDHSSTPSAPPVTRPAGEDRGKDCGSPAGNDRSGAQQENQGRREVQPQTQRDQNLPVHLRSQSLRGEDITTCKWLYYGDYIGNETRTIEFKKGSKAYMESIFCAHVHKYGCAFLNSGGGSLLVGVHDSGEVCGVFLTHQMEDQARLQVDWAVKSFRPRLLPYNYSLDFLPVVEPGDERNLKVVRLTFTVPPAFAEPTLFHVGAEQVYLRLDGSVQGPVGVSVIIQWSREKWGGKVQQLERYLREAIAEKCALAGQVQGLLRSIQPLHQIIAALQAQAASSGGSPASSACHCHSQR